MRAPSRTDQAAVDNAKLNLAYCHIIAPVTGRVGLRQVDPGNYVTPGDANGIVVITQMQPITVIFTLPEDNVPALMRRLQRRRDPAGRRPTTATRTTKLADRHADRPSTTRSTPTTGTVKLRAQFANRDERAVPEPVRQRPAAGRHAARRDDRADRGDPARRARHLRLCGQRRQTR